MHNWIGSIEHYFRPADIVFPIYQESLASESSHVTKSDGSLHELVFTDVF